MTRKKLVGGVAAALVLALAVVTLSVRFSKTPGVPQKIGASSEYAYPVGPAGGSLSGTYPNPSVTSCGSCSFPDSGDDGSGDQLLSYNPQTRATFSANPGDLAYFDGGWHVATFGGQGVAQFNDAGGLGCLTPSGGNKCVLEFDPDAGDGGALVLSAPICTNTCSSASGARAYYGPQTDGTATCDGAATVAGMSRSGSIYTLTRTVAFLTLTVNAGVTINTAGWGIFYDTLHLAGTIRADGGNGAGHAFYGGGSAGGTGDTGGGSGGAGQTLAGNVGLGGHGGAGGAGGGAGGEPGGAGGGLNNSIGVLPVVIPAEVYLSAFVGGIGGPTAALSPFGLYGGTGGGGGGCASTGTGACDIGPGGAGGDGGGVIVLSGRVRDGAGPIHARGAAGVPGVGGATGGGGGGGLVIDICGDKSGYSGTIDENGGSGANAGANGTYVFFPG